MPQRPLHQVQVDGIEVGAAGYMLRRVKAAEVEDDHSLSANAFETTWYSLAWEMRLPYFSGKLSIGGKPPHHHLGGDR